MGTQHPDRPDWDRLFETASTQEGHFTTRQAAEAGYSPQLLVKYLRSGRVIRVQRGVYRLVHFPPGEHEDLVAVWLWSKRAGIFSHETALLLHSLSDVLPARIHLTVPAAWRPRRLRTPKGVVLHHADIDERERAWMSVVPVTSPLQTLVDCVGANVAPDIIQQAVKQATARGLVARKDILDVQKALDSYDGKALDSYDGHAA